MPPYGTPYATIYPHGGVYVHPAVPMVSLLRQYLLIGVSLTKKKNLGVYLVLHFLYECIVLLCFGMCHTYTVVQF